MEKFDIIRIMELIIAVVGSAIITRILTIRARIRQEQSAADKAETEVKADQIENIEKLVEKVYKPTIETLTKQVAILREKVEALEQDKDSLRDKVETLEEENKELRAENERLRSDYESLRQEASWQNKNRGPDGKFAKKEGGEA